MGKRWDCVWVCSVKINLRLRSAQSTIAVCTPEARVPNRGTVTLWGCIQSRNVVFTIEVWPLDLAWGK